MNLQKRIRKADVPSAVLECPHIRAARRFIAFVVAQQSIRERLQQSNPRMTRREWGVPNF